MTDVKGMPDDLRWLAENVSEWGGAYTYSYIFRDRCFNRDDYSAERMDGYDQSFTREEWQAARQQLGLEPASVSDKTDMVNHPPHYQLRQGYEVYDLRQDLAAKAAQANVPHDQYSDWDRMLEYSLRCWQKNGVEDLKKARWYLDKLIEKLEAQK